MNQAPISSDFNVFLKAEGLVMRQRVVSTLKGEQKPISTENEQA